MVRVSQYIRDDEEGSEGSSVEGAAEKGAKRSQGERTGEGNRKWRLEARRWRSRKNRREMGCTIEGEWRKHLPAAR